MPGKPRFDLELLRRLVRERVEASSIRAVAEEIGVPRGGLESFLEDREPYSKTRVKLAAWYERQRSEREAVRPSEIDAAIALLNRYAQSAGTPAGRERRLRDLIGRLSAEPSHPSPPKRL